MVSDFILLGGWIIDMIVDGMKWLTHLIDKGVYTLVQVSYQVFSSLAQATILNDRIVTNITNRMYTILAIVMVFVLAFNLLNYIIDPDKVTDKQVGASAFVKDAIIALAVISLTPMLFTKLYSFQSKVLESGVVSNLILGGNSDELTTVPQGEDPARYAMKAGSWRMTASVYTAFVYPKDNYTVLDCGTGGTPSYMNKYCDAYNDTLKDGDIGHFSDFITSKNFEFTPFLSTIAGVVLLFFTISFCITLAKRVGKLAIIQLVAPIPVTLELVPGKKGLRKTWFENLIKSYLEVFMYLLVMYAVVLLISLVPDAVVNIFDNGGDWGLVKVFTIVFLIYGLLQFGKEAPQLLFDLLGIKQSGFIKDALKGTVKMGKDMATFGTVGAGLTAGSITRFSRNFNSTEGGFGKKLASGLAGAGSGAVRTLKGATKVHSAKEARELNRNVNSTVTEKKVTRDAYAHAHKDDKGGVIGAHIRDIGRSMDERTRAAFGTPNDYQKKLRQEQVLSEYKQMYKDNIEKLWTGDSKWSTFNSEKLKAEAAGDTERVKAIQKLMDERKQKILEEHSGEVTAAAVKINAFIDSHRGIEGVSDKRIDIDGAATAADLEKSITQTVKGTYVEVTKSDGSKEKVWNKDGYEGCLTSLSNDKTFQKQKVADKARQESKTAAQKAAKEASSGGDKKGS